MLLRLVALVLLAALPRPATAREGSIAVRTGPHVLLPLVPGPAVFGHHVAVGSDLRLNADLQLGYRIRLDFVGSLPVQPTPQGLQTGLELVLRGGREPSRWLSPFFGGHVGASVTTMCRAGCDAVVARGGLDAGVFAPLFDDASLTLGTELDLFAGDRSWGVMIALTAGVLF